MQSIEFEVRVELKAFFFEVSAGVANRKFLQFSVPLVHLFADHRKVLHCHIGYIGITAAVEQNDNLSSITQLLEPRAFDDQRSVIHTVQHWTVTHRHR